MILATNPIFPTNADATRLSWIGLKMEDFDLVTDYANSCHSKPNPAYYQDILDQFHLDPARCLMIGNDVQGGCAGRRRRRHPRLAAHRQPHQPEGRPHHLPGGDCQQMVDYLKQL